MDNPIGQQISNHLEFLGYEIKDNSTADLCTFNAKAVSKPHFIIDIQKDDFVMILSRVGRWEKGIYDSLEFHNLIHKANQRSTFCTWYAQKTDDGISIWVQSWFFGYEKKAFGRFVESFCADWSEFILEFGKLMHF